MIKINLQKKDLRNGDCLEILRLMNDNSIDSIVTDPPYGISFMGKKWDYDVPAKEVFAEMLRVLKPGAHALIACGTRTQHRMAINIEDAGFEIRDVVTWLYGSGFPKSMNLKDEWQGWGTALKPACEFWTLARKPLSEKTVTENVVKFGTGALNIDACRIEYDENGPDRPLGQVVSTDKAHWGNSSANSLQKYKAFGRWPANLILDEEAAAQLDLFTGELKSGRLTPENQVNGGFKGTVNCYGTAKEGGKNNFDANSGGASRFFYVAKASKSEKNSGLEEFPDAILAHSCGAASGNNSENPEYGTGKSFNSIIKTKNNHPTVKPVKLMAYLCRLVTPPNGTVLDPFMGSGSTGVAAIKEGFGFIGIEREKSYFEIASARIDGAA